MSNEGHFVHFDLNKKIWSDIELNQMYKNTIGLIELNDCLYGVRNAITLLLFIISTYF